MTYFVLIKRVYTPSPVAIAYTTMNGMENLRFDKEGYFHISVSYGLFYKKKGKENISLVFPYVIETPVKVWENPKIAWKRLPYGLVFLLRFLVPRNFQSCF